MTRERFQNVVLLALIAMLLLGIARIYQTFQDRIPLNLEGNIAIEGGPTANPPAP
ncbi:MAG: hypothetical protein ABL996_10755 [Micropepsaceae bacterium]